MNYDRSALSTMNSHSYELFGSFSIIDGNITEFGLKRVIRRSSVIAVYQLFLDCFKREWNSGNYWYLCRPFVATHLEKIITDSFIKQDSKKSLTGSQALSINEERFVPNGPGEYLRDGSRYESNVTGCFETIEEGHRIIISYNLKIKCSKGDAFQGCGKMSPEPHLSWQRLFDIVKEQENYHSNKHLPLATIDNALQRSQRTSLPITTRK